MKTVHAIFEKGMFRPIGAVELPERCEVEFEPRPVGGPQQANGNLDRIFGVLSERFESGDKDVAAQHDQHQP